MKAVAHAVIVVVGGLAIADVALACGGAAPTPKRTAESPRYVVAWQTTPAPPVVGEHFVVDLTVCPKPGVKRPSSVRIDAQMPEHRHGMNYRPSLVAAGGERYRAQGLMFHMPGRWVMTFELSDGAATDRLTAEMVLK